MSVCRHFFVICPVSKILFEKDLKCIYKLPEEENVTFDVRWIVRLSLNTIVSLSSVCILSLFCSVHFTQTELSLISPLCSEGVVNNNNVVLYVMF